MIFYSYCPKCEVEELTKEKPIPSWANMRGGWGRPIYHFACPNCGFKGAGVMCVDEWIEKDTEGTKFYVRDCIKYYEEDFK